MIIPEPERTIPIGHEDQDLDFRMVLRRLRKQDRELFQEVGREFTAKNWTGFIAELKQQKPKTFQKLKKLTKGTFDRATAREILRSLKPQYKCDEGFTDVPQKRTVVVRLKHSNVITGLPKEIMRQSIRLAKDYGGKRKWTMGFDNRAFTADLDPAAIEELRKNPAVEDVEEGGECHILTAEIPTYNPLAVNTDWGVARVPAAVAWALGYYGQGVKLCVIDTGIQKGNAAFWKDGETCYKGGYNMVAGSDDPEDDHDHGTYCCSMIAHQHTGLPGSYRGIAPSVDLYAVKVLDAKGSGTLANCAAGIDWARENGMDIISMSLGAEGGIPALQQACDAAWYAGILVVCAAGNSGPDDDTVNWPAAYASTIAVAAVDYNEFVASFSSRGAEVEISAPGVAIVGALAGFTYTNRVVPGSGGKYFCASGTSAACPHVAAAACLIKSWYPLATALELRTLLRQHLRDL